MFKVIIFLAFVSLIDGCLITNCPTGGKRSSPPFSLYHRFRDSQENNTVGDCRRCGPSQKGRCVNQSICCGPKIGCLVGTPAILAECSNFRASALQRGKPCSIGVCLSDGVCCSKDGCKMDYSCEMETETDICDIAI